jgi:hypothetical protein
MSQFSWMFCDFDTQQWFVQKLKGRGSHVYTGITTPEMVWARIGEVIVSSNLCNTTIDRRADGKRETFAQAFERITGKSLTQERLETSS